VRHEPEVTFAGAARYDGWRRCGCARTPARDKTSRKVLAGGAAIGLVGNIGRGAVGLAKQPNGARQHPPNSTRPTSNVADGLTGLPRTMPAIPRQAPPGSDAALAGVSGVPI